MASIDLKAIAEDALTLKDEVISLRREFHINPELSFMVKATSKRCNKYCEDLEIDVENCCKAPGCEDRLGLIATIRPDIKHKAIALRADMDALPIQEETSLEFRSRVTNIAHLSGHDAHTAMLLCAGKIISKHKAELVRPIKLIFQPAEEKGAGARIIVAEGHLTDVCEIYGIHVHPHFEVGALALREGVLMASADGLSITVEGKGAMRQCRIYALIRW